MYAHADRGRVGCHVPSEDLADADLRRLTGLVLVADQPERDHAPTVRDGFGTDLDQAEPRRVQPGHALRLPDHEIGSEPVLADGAADRPGELPGLQRGDPDRPVELRAPGLLVFLDQQP
jgi:hypothetical protein